MLEFYGLSYEDYSLSTRRGLDNLARLLGFVLI
jgi:hypothetical protein